MKSTASTRKANTRATIALRTQESAVASRSKHDGEAFPSPASPDPRLKAEHVNDEPGYRVHAKSLGGSRQLFVEGRGGSMDMDLSGIGVHLHKESFALQMPDDSMRGMNIRKGDIAIIEPFLWHLCEGSVVMVEIDGSSTLRRVTWCGQLMYFRADDDCSSPLLPAYDYCCAGMVTAVLQFAKRGELVRHPVEPAPSQKKHDSELPSKHLVFGRKHQFESVRLRDEPAKGW